MAHTLIGHSIVTYERNLLVFLTSTLHVVYNILTTNIAGIDWSVAIRALTGISAFIRITQALGMIRASIKST